MSDAMPELDSVIPLAQEAVRILKEENPKHELLQWGEIPFDTGSVPQSFMERFGGEHVSEKYRGTSFEMEEVYRNYYEAIDAILRLGIQTADF